MKSWLVAMSLLLAGCQAAPGALDVRPVTEAAPVAAPVAEPLAAPGVVRERVTSQALDPLAPFRRIAERGGIVSDFRHLVPTDDTYQVQLVPTTTQERAQTLAAEWASDARQILIGWGFFKHPMIGFARHGYYSPSKRKALMLDFAVTKRYLHARAEEPGDKYEDAALMLRDAKDTYRYTAKEAVELAKQAGYVPAKLHVGALIHMTLYGPAWVFLDDRDWSPYCLVKAESGEVVKSGPMMEAARLLIQPHQKQPEPDEGQ